MRPLQRATAFLFHFALAFCQLHHKHLRICPHQLSSASSFQVHEIGHVLGIGTLWLEFGLVDTYMVPCPYKWDSAASQKFRQISGCNGTVPLEQETGFDGSDCGHWAESCFNRERMTFNGGNLISEVTIGSLEDMGYDVNYSAADNFQKSDLTSACQCDNRRLRGNSNSFLDQMTEEVAFVKSLTNSQRRLSDEGRAAAIAFGRGIMLSRGLDASLNVYYGGDPYGDPYQDVGRHLIMVLYEEDGHEYSIRVEM